MKHKYDVVIVGGGPAGGYLSYNLAKDGFNVCLIDSNPIDRVGFKACGGISSDYILNYLKKINLNQEAIIDDSFEEVNIIDTKLNTLASIKINLVHLDREAMGKELSNALRNENISILSNLRAIKLLIRNSSVHGVKLSDGSSIETSLVVDASGFNGLLRQQASQYVPYWHITKSDLVIAIMEILKGAQPFRTFTLTIDKSLIPGGYGWITPSQNKSAIGLGLKLDVKNVSLRYRLLLLKRIVLAKGEKKRSLIGLIYARRPFPTLVYNGYALVGEAGSQGNPLFGGGILGAFIGSDIAFKSLRKSLESNDEHPVSIDSLWRYNFEFMHQRGKFLATLDALRMFAQSLSEDEMKEFISHLPSKLTFDLKDIVKIGVKAIKMISKSRIFWRIFDMYRANLEIQKLYSKYPKRPQDFEEWVKKDLEIFESLRNKLLK